MLRLPGLYHVVMLRLKDWESNYSFSGYYVGVSQVNQVDRYSEWVLDPQLIFNTIMEESEIW